MDNKICYLNTDLDLVSAEDLTALVAAFEARGLGALYHPENKKGSWLAVTFETERSYAEPEPNISAMLDVIESLAKPLRSMWAACSKREFNIGYDCGLEPWAFHQRLSSRTLGRISAGASLVVTLYPDRE